MTYYGCPETREVEEYIRWKNSQSSNRFTEILELLFPDGRIPHQFHSHWKLTWDYISKQMAKGARWDFRRLSMNPNITLQIVKENLHLSWDWGALSQRASWADIQDNLALPWDPENISRNSNITTKIVRENPRYAWSFVSLARNKNIAPKDLKEIIGQIPDDLMRFLRIQEDMNDIELEWCQHPLLTIDVVRGFGMPDSDPQGPDYLGDRWLYLSRNMPQEVIEANPDLPWDYAAMKANPTLTLDFIRRHYKDDVRFEAITRNRIVNINVLLELRDKSWDWKYLSRTIPLKDILAHPEMPWNSIEILFNPSVNLDYVRGRGPAYIENMCMYLSASPVINIEFILENPNVKWYWKAISVNPKISAKDVLEHPELPWDRAALLKNPNVTKDILDPKLVPKKDRHFLGGNLFDLTGLDTVDQTCLKEDIKRRRGDVKGIVTDIFGRDVCSVVLLYVSYD